MVVVYFKTARFFQKIKMKRLLTCPLIDIVIKEPNILVHCKRTEKPCPVW